MSLDLTDDMDIFDYLQQGVYCVREPGDVFQPYPDVECLRRMVRKQFTPVNELRAQQDSTTWHIKKADLDECGLVPNIHDRIREVDCDTVWWIESVSLETLGTRYKCEAQRVKGSSGIMD